MATILQDEKRRCDAACYDAKHDHCDCICEGKNHRKGLAVALANSAEDERAIEIWLVYYQPTAHSNDKLFCAHNDEESADQTVELLLKLGAYKAWYEVQEPVGSYEEIAE